MSSVVTTAGASSPVASPDGEDRRELFDTALSRIMAEGQCTRVEAALTLEWIDGFVNRARDDGYEVQYPTANQMAGLEYRIFDVVVGHGVPSKEESAHQAIEAALLDPAKGELALTHDQRGGADRRYCAVEVMLRAVS